MWAHYEVRTRALPVCYTGNYDCHTVLLVFGQKVLIELFLELSAHGYTRQGSILANTK